MSLAHSKTLLSQFLDIYYNKEDWHHVKMSEDQAYSYFKQQLENGNLIYYEKNQRLYGYIELWFINDEQVERVLGLDFLDCVEEDTVSGNNCYVANAFILPKYRGLGILKMLHRKAEAKYQEFDGNIYFQSIKNSSRIKKFRRKYNG